MASSASGDRAQGALGRAVERERQAIKLHETAAAQQEEIAARLERSAMNDPDDLLQEEALDAAANARQRAQAARERAATARRRLIDEGFDPDG